MRRLFYLVCLVLIAVNLYFSAYLVLHNDLRISNDIGRDFLLLREISEKKIILIGPRSNANGLFHGPLWSYVNYPIFALSDGNPMATGWFWVGLTAALVGSGWWVARKLFGPVAAAAYAVLLSMKMVGPTGEMFHSFAPIFVMPIFLYTVLFYLKTKQPRYLVFHLVAAAVMTQFNIGVGVPFLLLTGLLLTFFIIRQKLWLHLLVFAILPVLFANFIFFDLRHDFQLIKAAVAFSADQKHIKTYEHWLEDRLYWGTNLQLTDGAYPNPNLEKVFFAVTLLGTILLLRRRHPQRPFYLLVCFYFFGYVFLTFFNKGIILVHFTFLLIPLTTLWFVSFLETKWAKIFLPLFFLSIMVNLFALKTNITNLDQRFIGKFRDSWLALSAPAKAVVTREQGQEFGYFPFSPDAFAYQLRYALLYNFESTHAKSFEYVKKPTTYVIAAPPPENDPYMTHVWWRKNSVAITAEPTFSQTFPGGYVIEEFALTPEEMAAPHDKNIELGLHFR